MERMISQLAHKFIQFADEYTVLRFWFTDDEYMPVYIKEVFVGKDGSLVGLGIGKKKTDGNWGYVHWNEDTRFSYHEEDQVVDEKEWIED